MADNDKTPDPPAPQTQADIDRMVGQTVNNMLTARFGTFEKKLHEKLGATLDEKLAAFQPAPSKDKDDEPDDKDGKGKNKGEVASLRAELTALRTRQEETERERQALLLRQRETGLRSSCMTILGNAGITGDRFEAAYSLLVMRGNVRAHEDPNNFDGVFNDPAAGGDIPLEMGLTGWLKGETAKIFLPPSGVRGSGGLPPRGGAPNGKPMTDQERRVFLANRLIDDLNK